MTTDELMATEVMGWKWSALGDWKTKDKTFVRDWRPSTDMNQAMECVEVMVAKGYTIELRLSKLEGLGLSVLVRIGSKLIRIHFEHLKEAPLAICKAILKAKGIEIEWR
jgi:hypothetical protein